MKTSIFARRNVFLLATFLVACICKLIGATEDVSLKRFLFVVRLGQHWEDLRIFNHDIGGFGADAIGIVCNEFPSGEILQIASMSNTHQGVSTTCPLDFVTEETLLKASWKNITVFRLSECSSGYVDLLSWFLIEHYSRLYSFFIPILSLETNVASRWKVLTQQFFETYATNQEVRRFWADYTYPSHKEQLLVELKKSSFAINLDEMDHVLSNCSPFHAPATPKHFVYLATAETKGHITFEHNLVDADSDAIFCIWGEPPPQVELECEIMCHEDISLCRQVCKESIEIAQSRDKDPFQYVYIRGSSFQEGRNFLLQEARRRGNYAYFVFMVDDMVVNHRNFQSGLMGLHPFRTLENYLRAWQPAVAVPGATRRDEDYLIDPAGEVVPIYGFDHLLIAVHHDAVDLLLPYTLRYENVSWWYSQHVFNLISAMFFGPEHVIQIHAIVAETFNAGYVSYPHEIEFDVPLSWIITAAKDKNRLNSLFFHEHNCPSPKDFRSNPKIGPMAEGYNRILLEGKDFNACHPYFRSFSSRKSEYLQREGFSPALCADPDPSVSSMLVELMKEEEIHNGTICYWCMMHPKSPETSNCANRISGAELKQETSAGRRLYSGEQQLRLGVDKDGNLLS
uniref:Uncharacterized protein n=1 Tax=Hanusia phi TaxID=3032 RepID=A0A7S0HBB7_9CRYP|mmetsp:Transcript_14336/g.32989  ORF Transcript_14336/g.32989 Transcript_14336/m.32989 type:complete len:625 (+) Transcript_14336:134-2008(+)